MQKSNPIRLAVFYKFRSVSEFARSIQWSVNKAYRIVNGIQIPDSDEVIKMAQCLEVSDQSEFIDIFFAPLSTTWTKDDKNTVAS